MQMIKFIEGEDVDVDKWDRCVRRSVNSMTYAYSWYLDIVVQDWDALVLKDYEAVFPLPKRKKFNIQYSYTPFWIQQLGLFSQTSNGLEKIENFIESIPRDYSYLQLNLNSANVIKQTSKYKVTSNNNYVVSLDRPYQDIVSAYSKNLKRNLIKAQKEALYVFKNDSPKTVISMFRADKGNQFKHIKDADYKRLEELMHSAIYRHCGQLIMTYDSGNRPIAGMFVLFNHNRVTLLFTANSPEGRSCGAMAFLIDSLIAETANSGMSFDFEGSNSLSLARFYKSFGAVNESYSTLKINRLPAPLRWFKS
jgi:hypothetical protein